MANLGSTRILVIFICLIYLLAIVRPRLLLHIIRRTTGTALGCSGSIFKKEHTLQNFPSIPSNIMLCTRSKFESWLLLMICEFEVWFKHCSSVTSQSNILIEIYHHMSNTRTWSKQNVKECRMHVQMPRRHLL